MGLAPVQVCRGLQRGSLTSNSELLFFCAINSKEVIHVGRENGKEIVLTAVPTATDSPWSWRREKMEMGLIIGEEGGSAPLMRTVWTAS
jgi:hypothetical protein